MNNSFTQGPAFFEYFKAFKSDATSLGAIEAPFFTDSAITGEISVGPYAFLNPGAMSDEPGFFRPAIIFRLETISVDLHTSLNRTDTDRYHGGTLLDELAALVSILLGMRVQAGPVSRTFRDANDRGRPIAWFQEPWPSRRPIGHSPKLPWMGGSREISNTAFANLTDATLLNAKEASALIKAARGYQEAIWIGEWEPARAWLNLVSAIEALSDFGKGRDATDSEQLKIYNSEMAGKLIAIGGEELLTKLAPHLKSLVGSTKKFCDFINAYLPEPPLQRPPDGFRISWTPNEIDRMMRSIYRHRSAALHEGTPFPMPMCGAPSISLDWPAPCELPQGLSSSSNQGSWLIADTPMFLHVFEHIVRHSILKWWTEKIIRAKAQTD